MTLFLLCGSPVAASLLAIVVQPYKRFVGWISVGLAGVSFAASVALCGEMLSGRVRTAAASDLWRVDALSGLFCPKKSIDSF